MRSRRDGFGYTEQVKEGVHDGNCETPQQRGVENAVESASEFYARMVQPMGQHFAQPIQYADEERDLSSLNE